MIVWLTYYPIAGAAVWHLISECFGCPVHHRLNPSFTAADGGQREWQRFYDQSSATAEIVFVRTQFPPQDGNPAIYVVRDGRESILAYYRHANAKHSDEIRTVSELILGFNFDGEWTSHYRSWSPAERAATLLLEYESVLQDPSSALREITAFTGIRRPCLPWRTAFGKLSEDDPRFKCRGPYRWRPTQVWSPHVESLFWRCHGALMTELGYSPLDPTSDFCLDPLAIAPPMPQDEIRLLSERIEALESAQASLNWEIRTLRDINTKRTETIHQLTAELALLRRARVGPREDGKR